MAILSCRPSSANLRHHRVSRWLRQLATNRKTGCLGNSDPSEATRRLYFWNIESPNKIRPILVSSSNPLASQQQASTWLNDSTYNVTSHNLGEHKQVTQKDFCKNVARIAATRSVPLDFFFEIVCPYLLRLKNVCESPISSRLKMMIVPDGSWTQFFVG